MSTDREHIAMLERQLGEAHDVLWLLARERLEWQHRCEYAASMLQSVAAWLYKLGRRHSACAVYSAARYAMGVSSDA